MYEVVAGCVGGWRRPEAVGTAASLLSRGPDRPQVHTRPSTSLQPCRLRSKGGRGRRQLLRLRIGGRVRPGEVLPVCTRAAVRAGTEIQVAPRSRTCHRRPSWPEPPPHQEGPLFPSIYPRAPSVLELAHHPDVRIWAKICLRAAIWGFTLTFHKDRSLIHGKKAERCDRHRARHVWGLAAIGV